MQPTVARHDYEKQTLGALALALGLGTRLSAFGISAAMLGALLMVQLPNGFFMNWFGNQPGEGIEFSLLMLALSVPLIVRGGGRYAVDSLLQKHLRRTRPEAATAIATA